MNQKNMKICRLCLKIICKDDFDRIDDISKHMLKTLLLNLVLVISKEPMMCSDCAAYLQKSFDFKLYCLKTENRVQPFTVSEANAKLNLVEIYLEERKNMINMPKDQRVCRICIEAIEKEYFFNLHVAKEDIVLINVLQNHIPELDLTITEDPVVCNICHQSLGDFYSFIKNCLVVEETIKRHVEINGADDMGQIDLSKIEHPTQLNDTYSKDILQPKLEDAYAESLKTEAISDDDMEIGDSKLTVSEEIESTSYRNPESLQEPSPETNIKTEEALEIPRIDSDKIKRKLMRKNPSKIKIHMCDVCPYESKRKYSVERHKLTHKEPSEIKMYKCEICMLETKHKSVLKRHRQWSFCATE